MHSRLMEMSWEIAVCVRADAMMMFPGCGQGINMHNDIRQIPQLAQQLMLHFSRDPVANLHREGWIDGDIHLG